MHGVFCKHLITQNEPRQMKKAFSLRSILVFQPVTQVSTSFSTVVIHSIIPTKDRSQFVHTREVFLRNSLKAWTLLQHVISKILMPRVAASSAPQSGRGLSDLRQFGAIQTCRGYIDFAQILDPSTRGGEQDHCDFGVDHRFPKPQFAN